jgi:hypothetical protein
VVQILGVALVLARLASAIGLNRTLGQSPPRQLGASVTGAGGDRSVDCNFAGVGGIALGRATRTHAALT